MIEVLTSGFYTSIQDLGREHYQQYGVPFSGVMDRTSALMANKFLKNKREDALLEITMTGPKLRFNQSTKICITGADMQAQINSNPIDLNKVHIISVGDVLSFGRLQYGFRTYLAVAGGIQSKLVLGSRSWYVPVTKKGVIKKGELLAIVDTKTNEEHQHSILKMDSNHFTTTYIDVYKGPEFDLLPKVYQQKLFEGSFTISKCNNRMAYQLDSLINANVPSIITSLVLPGTVQLTPAGKLIILMRDGQTTGGYARVLQLSENAINVLSQKFTGSEIVFVLKSN